MRPGWATGVFICLDPDQRQLGRSSTAWVHAGGRMLQVTLGQLRPAHGHEHFLPSEHDWELLQRLRDHPEQALHDAVDLREEYTEPPVIDADELVGLPSDTLIPLTPAPASGSRTEIPTTPTPASGSRTEIPPTPASASKTEIPSTPLVPLPQFAQRGVATRPSMSVKEEPAAKRAKPMSALAVSMYSEATLLQDADHGWDGGATVGGERIGWHCRATSSQVVLDSDQDNDAYDTDLFGAHVVFG
eukprot:5228291-Amphidinium_carterae.1